MPFYDYRCEKCEAVQEEYHTMLAEPTIKCNKCASLCVKMIHGVGCVPSKAEVWDYNDVREVAPKWLKSRDGKTRVRYDPSKHGFRKGRGY